MKNTATQEQEQDMDHLDALLPEGSAQERDFLLRLLMAQKNEEATDLMMDIASAQDALNRERLEQEVWGSVAKEGGYKKAKEFVDSCKNAAEFMEDDLEKLQEELSMIESFIERARDMLTTEKYKNASDDDMAFFAQENDMLYDGDNDACEDCDCEHHIGLDDEEDKDEDT